MMSNNSRFVAESLRQTVLIVLIALALSLPVNYFRQGSLSLFRERAVKTGSITPGDPAEQVISLDEARALFLTEGAVFIDARPEEVFRAGHIKGALNLPPDEIGETLPDFMTQIPHDSLIIAYCDGEHCSLSEDAAFFLASMGYTHVQVMKNGWTVWQGANMPTETGP
jgi:rhodanese-related sulfurtransferase